LQQVVWKGRLQWLEPNVLVDAAHNPAGLRRLRLALEEFSQNRFQRVILIIGMLADKDYEAAMDEILPVCDEVIAVTPDSARALPANILADLARNWGRPAREANGVPEAIAMAKKQSSRDDLIVITGSHFVLSEIENL
jgi:dihydrofolate synthase/folylpolyglutamate synthase